MQIEEGKFYKTRDGRKVGPMKYSGFKSWPFVETFGNGKYWMKDGVASGGEQDIIAEWTDAPQYEVGQWYPWTGGECPVDGYAVVSVMFRDGDFAKDTARWWEWCHDDCDVDIIAFRVDAYPEQEERVECYRGEKHISPIEHGTCIKRGGVIDWSTWESLE